MLLGHPVGLPGEAGHVPVLETIPGSSLEVVLGIVHRLDVHVVASTLTEEVLDVEFEHVGLGGTDPAGWEVDLDDAVHVLVVVVLTILLDSDAALADDQTKEFYY